MLLLTDRPGELDQLVASLSSVLPCSTVGLARYAGEASGILVVCDVAFGGPEAHRHLRSVLDRSRENGAPLLCLLRDASQPTFALARELGATAVLSAETHPVELAARIRQLLSARTSVQLSLADARLSREVHLASQALNDLFSAARSGQPVPISALVAGSATVVDAVERTTLGPWLDLVRQHDDATFRHSLLVTGLTAAFSVRIGLMREHQVLLAQAALVHDIGKVAIPATILNKPGQLSAAETALIRTHAVRGREMLALASGIDARILDIVQHHHELLDGSGYPDRLRGEQVSALVRLVTICDIYAALIEHRPYKHPVDPPQALDMLEAMGGKLDRGLVALFREMIVATRDRRAA